MLVADALSRACLSDSEPEVSKKEMSHHVHSLISSLPISDGKLKEFQVETAKDPVLQTLKKYTIDGWPSYNIDPRVKPFFSQRHDIVYNHDLLLKGLRIIVPQSMQSSMKQIIHQGNIGIEKCKWRARQTVYWPRINLEISDMVSNCSTCLDNRNRQGHETLHSHEIPDGPWLKVATDLFTIYSKDYLVVVDYYSKFFEVAQIRKPCDSPAVVNATKKIFSTHSIPKKVFSDGGPQFTAAGYDRFAK